MKIIPEPIAFEWDKGNGEKNEKKHGISNKEIEQAFDNDPKIIFSDEAHSLRERRYGMYGSTNEKVLLSIVFTIRDEKVRVISARRMSKKERRAYEKIKKDTSF